MSASGPFVLATPSERVGSLTLRKFGSGRPLVLFYGGAGSWPHWVANVEGLARIFEVIAVDLLGYGDSAAPNSEEPELYVDAVATDIARAVGAGMPFALAGFSFGSAVAAAVARRLPGQVRGIEPVANSGIENGSTL